MSKLLQDVILRELDRYLAQDAHLPVWTAHRWRKRLAELDELSQDAVIPDLPSPKPKRRDPAAS